MFPILTIDPTRPYCIYTQIYEDGAVHHNYGTLSRAVTARYDLCKFYLEIIDTFDTIDAARIAFYAREETSKTRIMCHQTGGVFDTVLSAAAHIQGNQSALSGHLRHGSPKHIKGFTFQYVDSFLFDLHPGVPLNSELIVPKVGKKFQPKINNVLTPEQWAEARKLGYTTRAEGDAAIIASRKRLRQAKVNPR